MHGVAVFLQFLEKNPRYNQYADNNEESADRAGEKHRIIIIEQTHRTPEVYFDNP